MKDGEMARTPAIEAGDEPAGSTARRGKQQFGAILRERRRALDLTLHDLAQKTGLTKSFLSDVERDKTSPSVASLVSLCDALDMPIGDLFSSTQSALVRAEDRQLIKFGGVGVVDHLLTPGRGTRMQAIWSEIAPGGTGGDELYSLRAEEELVLVLFGELALNIEGEEIVLGSGDAMTFDPRRPHSFHNPSTALRTTALFVITPPPR